MSTKVRRMKGKRLGGVWEKKLMVDINLTENAMKKVLRFLTYEERLSVRLVSRSFNTVISKMMNEDFENLGDKIDSAINEASKFLKRSYLEQTAIRHFKILYYLRAEYNVIKVTMQKYLEHSLVTYTGGNILRCFHKILRIHRNQMQESNEYMKIFHLVEVYLNNFGMEVDDVTRLKNKNTFNESFGLKIVDILDCGLDFGRNIQFSQGPDCVYLEAEYHGKDVNLFEDLPDMNKQMMTELELKNFVQMMRNNIRWSNLLFCIQRETNELAQDYFTPMQKITSRTNLTLRKDLTNVLNMKEKDISYILNLKCSRDNLPPRIVKLMRDNLSVNVYDWSKQKKSNIDSPNEFNMLIKLKTKTEDGAINEKVVKMYQVGDEYVSSEFNKLVSVFR